MDRNEFLGKRYEVAVGRELERKNLKVIYSGLAFNEYDKGIDLVAYNEIECIVVQCKWHSGGTDYSVDEGTINKYSESMAVFLRNLGHDYRQNIEFRLYTNKEPRLRNTYDYAKKKGIELVVTNWPDVERISESDIIDAIPTYRYDLYSQTKTLLKKARDAYVVEIEKNVPHPESEKPIVKRKRHFLPLVIIISFCIALMIMACHCVYYAPYSGVKYHSSAACEGLENARDVRSITWFEAKILHGLEPCGYCH